MIEKNMVLEVYLNGELLDSAHPAAILPGIELNKHLNKLMQELLGKHTETLSQSKSGPVFVLSGLPSRMNHFKPLRHR